MYIDQSGIEDDNFDLLEMMGITNSNNAQEYQLQNTEAIQVQRLFTGEDSTSIGSLFTTQANPKNKEIDGTITVTTSDITRTNTSSLTNNNDQTATISNMSNEIQTLKDLIQNFINTNVRMYNTEPMEVQEEYGSSKRKAGDIDISPCEGT
jgi:hypothetical protein